MSETKPTSAHANVFAALAAAQAEMSAPIKDAVNPHFRSKYADLAAVMAAAMPALNRHGIAIWHSTVTLDGRECLRTTISHGASGTHIDCDVRLIVSKQDMQGYKSAITYAKRIGVESVAGLAPEDDDGNAAAKAAPSPQERQEEAAQVAAAAIQGAIAAIMECRSPDELRTYWIKLSKQYRDVARDPAVIAAKDEAKAMMEREA